MTICFRHCVFLAIAFATAISPALAIGEDSGQKTIRVLTVGNSFADNALTYLPDLAKAAGCGLVIGKANLGGCTFERHWNHLAAYQNDPDSPAGSPYGKGKNSLADLLNREKWDYITIQQVSYRSHDLDTYFPYARDLLKFIRKHAPDSKVLAHQIWAYRIDDPRFKPGNKGKEPHTQEVMFEDVRSAYHQLLKELQLDGIIPSGDAMYSADTNPKWGFQPDRTFDPDMAEYPDLPVQKHSLHVGWQWRKKDGKRLLRMDGHHASQAGKYLLGCVWFEVLFGQSVEDNEFVPHGLDEGYANFLRQTAHRVVGKD